MSMNKYERRLDEIVGELKSVISDQEYEYEQRIDSLKEEIEAKDDEILNLQYKIEKMERQLEGLTQGAQK